MLIQGTYRYIMLMGCVCFLGNCRLPNFDGPMGYEHSFQVCGTAPEL